jgi:hypothetical protein
LSLAEYIHKQSFADFLGKKTSEYRTYSMQIILKSLCHIARQYFSAGNNDVLDVGVHQNIGLSRVNVCYILDSDHLLTVFHILNHVTINQLLEPLEKFTEWEQFQNIASNLISPRTEINLGTEADKVAQEFTASIASAYRFSTGKARTFRTKPQSSWFG